MHGEGTAYAPNYGDHVTSDLYPVVKRKVYDIINILIGSVIASRYHRGTHLHHLIVMPNAPGTRIPRPPLHC